MIELSEAGGGMLSRRYGGETLNTAVYLARLGVAVDYFTRAGRRSLERGDAVGLARGGRRNRTMWCACLVACRGCISSAPREGRGRSAVGATARWRGSCSSCRRRHALAAALAEYDLIYLSGVTLSLYGEAGRRAAVRGARLAAPAVGRIAFDTDFRTRGWPDRALAKAAYRTDHWPRRHRARLPRTGLAARRRGA